MPNWDGIFNNPFNQNLADSLLGLNIVLAILLILVSIILI